SSPTCTGFAPIIDVSMCRNPRGRLCSVSGDGPMDQTSLLHHNRPEAIFYKGPPSLWSTAVWTDSLPPPLGGGWRGANRSRACPRPLALLGFPPPGLPPLGGGPTPTARGGRQERRCVDAWRTFPGNHLSAYRWR